jgi:hypothetical protein
VDTSSREENASNQNHRAPLLIPTEAERLKGSVDIAPLIASEAKQSRKSRETGLLRRYAPRNDQPWRSDYNKNNNDHAFNNFRPFAAGIFLRDRK